MAGAPGRGGHQPLTGRARCAHATGPAAPAAGGQDRGGRCRHGPADLAARPALAGAEAVVQLDREAGQHEVGTNVGVDRAAPGGQEPGDVPRVACLALVVAGVVGLRLVDTG